MKWFVYDRPERVKYCSNHFFFSFFNPAGSLEDEDGGVV